jgi:hypothetical protein
MANLTHSETTAKSFMRLIHASKPNKRCAFALGKMGGKEAVVYVARGKPANAAKNLRITKFEPGQQPKGLSSDSVIVSAAGLLALDGTMLTVQCRGNPPEAMIKEGLKHYFTRLRVTPVWRDVSTESLADDDEGDDEEKNTISGQDEGAVESPAGTADGEPGRNRKPDPIPGDESESPASPGAARLAQLMLHLGRASDRHDDATREVLEQRFEELLKTIPIERLMLALCSRSGVEQIMGQAGAMVKHPIERNEKGYADTADALVTMGVEMAKQRHIVVDGEVPKSDTIAAMVKALWAKTPDAPAAEVVQSIRELLTQTFVNSDPARLRGMLGLPAKLPPAQQPASGPDADGEAARVNVGDNRSAAIAPDAAQGAWRKARTDAIADLRELSRAIAASGDSEAAEALHEIDAIIASLPPTLDRPVSADSVARFLEESPVAADVEGANGFGVALSIREPLLRALAPLRSAA